MTLLETLFTLSLGFAAGWIGRIAIPLLWSDFVRFCNRHQSKNWWDK